MRRSGAYVLAGAVTSACVLLAAAWGETVGLPSDLCALLPPERIGQVLGQAFRAPERREAPRAYKNTAPGIECDYLSEKPTGMGVPLKVLFTIYMESSPAAAKDVFTKVKAFFEMGLGPSTPVGGLGDAAYRDTNYALHVLKGPAHYAINFIPMGTFTPEKEQQEKDLAAWVAGRL